MHPRERRPHRATILQADHSARRRARHLQACLGLSPGPGRKSLAVESFSRAPHSACCCMSLRASGAYARGRVRDIADMASRCAAVMSKGQPSKTALRGQSPVVMHPARDLSLARPRVGAGKMNVGNSERAALLLPGGDGARLGVCSPLLIRGACACGGAAMTERRTPLISGGH